MNMDDTMKGKCNATSALQAAPANSKVANWNSVIYMRVLCHIIIPVAIFCCNPFHEIFFDLYRISCNMYKNTTHPLAYSVQVNRTCLKKATTY